MKEKLETTWRVWNPVKDDAGCGIWIEFPVFVQ